MKISVLNTEQIFVYQNVGNHNEIFHIKKVGITIFYFALKSLILEFIIYK